METLLLELIQRFVACFPLGENPILRPEPFHITSAIGHSKLPVYTLLVQGRIEENEKPLALVLLSSPSISVDDPAILEFAARRARAQKASTL